MCRDPTIFLESVSRPNKFFGKCVATQQIFRKVCRDPTNFSESVSWPNKMRAECVVAQQIVLRPVSRVIYDRSLILLASIFAS